MSALYRVICRACGWTGTTRYPNPSPNHRCPECASASLKIEPLRNRP
jgi:predicted Zn-ribbon and HTH transcriptional regulator